MNFLLWLKMGYVAHVYTSYKMLTNKSIFPGENSKMGEQEEEIPTAYLHLKIRE